MKVRFGVIGSGGIARRRTIPEGIIPASNAELVAVADMDTQSNKQVAGEFGVKACADIDELLAMPEVDAVYIATPTHCHKDQILKAMQAGKHVLCEKPLALNSTEADEILKACDKAKRVCGVGFMMRFNAYHRKVLEMVMSLCRAIPKPILNYFIALDFLITSL